MTTAAETRPVSAYTGILKGTGTYAIAILFTKMASFIMLPLYTRYLTPADYGVLELLSLTAFIVSALVFMRIGDSLCYYYSNATTKSEQEEALCTVFVTTIVLGTLCALGGCAAASWISTLIFQTARYTPCVKLTFVGLAFSFPVELGFAYLRLLNKTGVYVVSSVANLLLAIVCNVILLIPLHMGMNAMLWSSLIVAAITAGAMVLVSLRGVNVRHRFRFSLMRHFISYSLPLGGSGVGMFVLNFGDRFFLQRNVSLTEVGIYALAYKLGMLVAYIQAPFETYWRAQMFSIMKREDGEAIYIRMVTYVTAVLTFVTLLFVLFTGPALRLLVTGEYRQAAAFVPWIAAAYVVRSIGSQFRCVFVLEGKTNNELVVAAVGGGFCFIGYALLIPRFHLWGAVISTIFGFTVMLFIALGRAQKVRHFQFEYRRIAIVVLVATALGLPGRLWRPSDLGVQILLGCFLAAAFPFLLKLAGFFNAGEWSFVQQRASNIRHFLLAVLGHRVPIRPAEGAD